MEEEERQAAEEGMVNPSLLGLTVGIWVRSNASRQMEELVQTTGARLPRAQLQDETARASQRRRPVRR